MAINYHAAQDDFGSIVHRLQPMVLTNFVMWLDMKVAEFKVYGQMLLENENREIPNWYLRPNFDSETLVSMAKQKIQVPVSLVPKKVINKQTVHVPILPSHRNRSTRSQSATKLKNDTDKVIDSLEPTIVKHPRLHHAQGIDMLQEETDSSALTFVSKEYSQSDSPLYSTTRLEVSECEKRHMPSEETLNTSVEALDTSVEAIDSSQADSQCTARVVPKAEPVDEEFEVIENRLQTSTLSDTVDMLEHNIPLHDASVSSAIKTPLSTEKVAKTLVQSDGTMFLMPQTDKDATDTSGDPEDEICLLEAQETAGLIQPTKVIVQSNPQQDDPTNQSNPITLQARNQGETKSTKAEEFSISYTGDRRTFHCCHCNYKTQRKYNLSRHLENHAQIRKHHCSTCGKKFNEHYRLEEHVKCVHRQEMSCEMCGKTFGSKSGLKYHLDSHLQKYSCTCPICGQSFIRRYSLHIHMKRHSSEQEFACQYCKEVFTSRALRTAHKTKCVSVNPVLCPECGKLFKSKRLLVDHQRGVHGPRQYSCKCGQMFQWRSSLHYHMKWKCSAPFQSDVA